MDSNIIINNLLDLKESGTMLSIEEFFSGNTGVFDIRQEYNYTDYPDQINYSDNKIEEICKISMIIAENYLNQLKQEPSIGNVPETELCLYSAWVISKKLRMKLIKKMHYGKLKSIRIQLI